jgi:hypothetical protein
MLLTEVWGGSVAVEPGLPEKRTREKPWMVRVPMYHFLSLGRSWSEEGGRCR